MKTKNSKMLITFHTIRRGDWHIKTSMIQFQQILIVAKHITTGEVVIRCFIDELSASNFIEFIVEKGTIH
jgi:hypothetical protein